jgi:ketosteroid isomerase-like protein
MSQENVAIVRDFYSTISSNLETYWKEPRCYAEALERGELDPGSRRVLDRLDDDARWKTLIGEVRTGKLGFARGADELLRDAESYRLALDEITDLPDDRVLAAVRVVLTGRSSGVEGSLSFFAVFRLRDGLITEFDEYATRGEALNAVEHQE